MTTEELEILEEIRKYHKEENERKVKRNSEWEAFLKEFNSAEEQHLNDPKRKRWYDLGNGHTLMIQSADRGLEDDYMVEFYEDCKLLDREYATAEVINDLYNAAMRLAAGSGEDIALASDIVTGATTHELKIRPKFFEAVVSGKKTFEIRKNDRNFKVGDRIVLKEYNKETGFTGKSAVFDITYIMTDKEFVKKGFVVLGIKPYSPFLAALKAIGKAVSNET